MKTAIHLQSAACVGACLRAMTARIAFVLSWFLLIGSGATPSCLQAAQTPQIPRFSPPPPRAYTPPPAPRYTSPPAQSFAPSVVAPRVPDPTMRQMRDMMNQNQMQAQQRQTAASIAAGQRRWQYERDRSQAQMQEFQTQASIEAGRRNAQQHQNWMEAQARTAATRETSRQSDVRVPQTRTALSSLNRSAGQNHRPSEKITRFQQAEIDSTFYFPNDPERRYRWVKISPTMARNLVNGRTGLLPAGMTIIPAGTEPYLSGFWAEDRNLPQEPNQASSPGYNTLRVSNPNKYDAQVNVRSGNHSANLSVEAQSSSSVQLPDGTYQVFFQFSDRPGQRFQGDDVSLHGNIAEIQLVSVVGGNYGLRPVN